MYKLISTFIVLLISGCATTSLTPEDKIQTETEGILMMGVHLIGLPNNPIRNRPVVHLSIEEKIGNSVQTALGNVEADGQYSVLMIKLKSGKYQLGDVLWYPSYGDTSIIEQKLDCLGEFNIVSGKINYIGDLSIKGGKREPGFFTTTDYYSYGVFNNKIESLNRASINFDWLLSSYEVLEDFISPKTCH